MHAIRGLLTPSVACSDALLVAGQAAVCSRQRRSWRHVQCHGEDELLSCGVADLICGTRISWKILNINWRAEQQVASTSSPPDVEPASAATCCIALRFSLMLLNDCSAL
jgi:hypothetical protein